MCAYIYVCLYMHVVFSIGGELKTACRAPHASLRNYTQVVRRRTVADPSVGLLNGNTCIFAHDTKPFNSSQDLRAPMT